MKASELAAKVGLSRSQIVRLATAKDPKLRVPGHRRTKGRQHYFVSCPALDRWIEKQNQPPLSNAERQRKWRKSIRPIVFTAKQVAQFKAQKPESDEDKKFKTEMLCKVGNDLRAVGLQIQHITGHKHAPVNVLSYMADKKMLPITINNAQFCVRVANEFANPLQSFEDARKFYTMLNANHVMFRKVMQKVTLAMLRPGAEQSSSSSLAE